MKRERGAERKKRTTQRQNAKASTTISKWTGAIEMLLPKHDELMRRKSSHVCFPFYFKVMDARFLSTSDIVTRAQRKVY